MENLTLDDRQKAFYEYLDRHRGIIRKVSYSYCWHTEDRLDLEQEMLLQIWRAFAKYDRQQRFSTWMYRIALNVAISYVRKHSLKQAVNQSETEVEALSCPQSQSQYEVNEQWHFLEQFLQRLDVLNKALLLLYLEEHNYQEIADVLGITKTNVATKINRLKQRIKHESEYAMVGQGQPNTESSDHERR